jgi:hypothetical protein
VIEGWREQLEGNLQQRYGFAKVQGVWTTTGLNAEVSGTKSIEKPGIRRGICLSF